MNFKKMITIVPPGTTIPTIPYTVLVQLYWNAMLTVIVPYYGIADKKYGIRYRTVPYRTDRTNYSKQSKLIEEEFRFPSIKSSSNSRRGHVFMPVVERWIVDKIPSSKPSLTPSKHTTINPQFPLCHHPNFTHLAIQPLPSNHH